MTPAHLIAADHPALSFDSVLVLLTLMALLALAAGTLWALLWRETGNRRRAEVQDWARAAGFRHRHGFGSGLRVPPPLDLFAGAQVVEHYEGQRCAIVQFLVAAAPPAVDAASAPGDPLPPPATRRRNVLVWPIESTWPAAAGLRPATAGDSLIDLLALPPQETGTATARFVAHAADRRVATTLATSSLRGLLPPDVGLLLVGRHLVLEFSDRPFDAIEFNRMIAVAGQVVAHLPGQE